MRAVTGAITSSQPCPAAKVARVLLGFEQGTGSDVLSSDAATYLKTAVDAATELNHFRRDLRRRLQSGGGGGESEKKPRPAPADEGGRWEPKVEAEEYGRWEPKVEAEEEYGVTAPAAGERKSGKSKGSTEVEEPMEEKRGIAAANGDLGGSPASEKRRKKKEKHVKKEDETGELIGEQSRKALGDALQAMVSEEGIDSGKKARKKKHIKQEEEARDAKEAEQKMVHVENGLVSEEKKRKKRKHAEEEEVKKEAADDGELGSDKKRKKKRGRDGDDVKEEEVRDHTKKKQRK